MKKHSQTLRKNIDEFISDDVYQNAFAQLSKGSIVQNCNHCGHSVALGSGRFVNRIPDLNDICTRIANGLLFPAGNYVCEECDNNPKT